MPCFRPLHGFRGPVKENGKRDVVFKAPSGTERQVVPCGRCLGCGLEYARQWAFRCMCEASSHENNCVVTLTYDDEHYPPDGSLDVGHFQKFMKKLRRAFSEVYGGLVNGPRYYHCGEYGSKFGRAHYHALLFGVDFGDKVLHSRRDGISLYKSEALSSLWEHGHSLVGEVSYKSASYVARYTLKKVRSKLADEHYVDRRTGVLRKPEYVTMSRGGRGGRGGIGTAWFNKFAGDVFPSDEVIINGHSWKPPRFFDDLLAKSEPDLLEELKVKRLKAASERLVDDERLAVMEEVKMAEVKALKRSYEEE